MPWASTADTRRRRDGRRRPHRQPIDETVHDSVATDQPLPGEDLREAEKRRYLRAAVAALPERMRYVSRACTSATARVTEVAAELGITHSAVSQQRSEAMRLLRDGLAEHYGDGTAVEPVSRTTAARRQRRVPRRVAANAAAASRGPCTTPPHRRPSRRDSPSAREISPIP